jgi:hypothetical protein
LALTSLCYSPISTGAETLFPNPVNLISDHLEKVKKGKVIGLSEVYTLKDKQNQVLKFSISGMHPKSCRFALRKLRHYEKFHKYISIVKKSRYDEKKQSVYFLLDSSLLPFRMSLNFKIPRIKREGTYFFTFKKGMLKGLKGTIFVNQYKDRCIFNTRAYWRGKKVFSDMVFEFFSQAISVHTMKRLFRISAS